MLAFDIAIILHNYLFNTYLLSACYMQRTR